MPTRLSTAVQPPTTNHSSFTTPSRARRNAAMPPLDLDDAAACRLPHFLAPMMETTDNNNYAGGGGGGSSSGDSSSASTNTNILLPPEPMDKLHWDQHHHGPPRLPLGSYGGALFTIVETTRETSSYAPSSQCSISSAGGGEKGEENGVVQDGLVVTVISVNNKSNKKDSGISNSNNNVIDMSDRSGKSQLSSSSSSSHVFDMSDNSRNSKSSNGSSSHGRKYTKKSSAGSNKSHVSSKSSTSHASSKKSHRSNKSHHSSKSGNSDKSRSSKHKKKNKEHHKNEVPKEVLTSEGGALEEETLASLLQGSSIRSNSEKNLRRSWPAAHDEDYYGNKNSSSDAYYSPPRRSSLSSSLQPLPVMQQQRTVVCGMPWISTSGKPGMYTGEVNEKNVPDGMGSLRSDHGGIVSEGMWRDGELMVDDGLDDYYLDDHALHNNNDDDDDDTFYSAEDNDEVVSSTTSSTKGNNPPIKSIIPHVVVSDNNYNSDESSLCSNLSNDPDGGGTTASSTLSQQQPGEARAPMHRQMSNGWSVPLGVHKVICAMPGLKVSSGVHRRSMPVKVGGVSASNGKKKNNAKGKGGEQAQDLLIPPGSYVEILETQVHGERVRGRICWESSMSLSTPTTPTTALSRTTANSNNEKKKKTLIKKRTSRLLKRTNKNKRGKSTTYEGWISLQWVANTNGEGGEESGEDTDATSEEGNYDDHVKVEVDELDLERHGKREDDDDGGGRGNDKLRKSIADEDAGPWTEPVPLGVYRIDFGGGLPLRESPARDSPVLSKLHRGQCVEVVQTQVKGDRVRARVIVPNVPSSQATDEDHEDSSENNNNIIHNKSGWISLLNAITGSASATPVPIGAYVVVTEPGCVITQGARLDSQIKDDLLLAPGSCMEVVATRMEEGVVRGLIDVGGYVTLFVPPTSADTTTTDNSGQGSFSGDSRRGNDTAIDGGKMFAMPVPLGTYRIIQHDLPVTSGVSTTSSILMNLQRNANAEVVETRVENGRVRCRICAVVNEDGTQVEEAGYDRRVGYGRRNSAGTSGTGVTWETMSANTAFGWIDLFEPNESHRPTTLGLRFLAIYTQKGPLCVSSSS